MKKQKFIIPNGNSQMVGNVELTAEQILILLEEAHDAKQKEAALKIGRSERTTHHAIEDFNDQTGCRHSGGRVAWAVGKGVLVPENGHLVLAPKYREAIGI